MQNIFSYTNLGTKSTDTKCLFNTIIMYRVYHEINSTIFDCPLEYSASCNNAFSRLAHNFSRKFLVSMQHRQCQYMHSHHVTLIIIVSLLHLVWFLVFFLLFPPSSPCSDSLLMFHRLFVCLHTHLGNNQHRR